eukprot:2527280-Amphidinium_carterae.1
MFNAEVTDTYRRLQLREKVEYETVIKYAQLMLITVRMRAQELQTDEACRVTGKPQAHGRAAVTEDQDLDPIIVANPAPVNSKGAPKAAPRGDRPPAST